MSFMRTAFRDQLDEFSRDLIVMCDIVRNVMDKASDALMRGSLQEAEEALSLADDLEEVRARSEQRAVDLLLLESPVASDLRQVISSIYIVNDFRRMGALGMHVANTARRRHPEIAVPESVAGYFKQLAEETSDMATTTRTVLTEPSEELAYELATADDHIDELHQTILTTVTAPQWDGSNREAVDSALLARFYERYADHCVSIAARVVYLITGVPLEEDPEMQAHFDSDSALMRRFERLRNPR